MKFKYRLFLALALLFIMVVSFKILEPDLRNESDGDNSDYPVVVLADDGAPPLPVEAVPIEGRAVSGGTAARDARVQRFLDMYDVDWNYTLRGEDTWQTAGSWVTPRQIHPESMPEMGAILRRLAKEKILSADIGYRGTQLKMTLMLRGNQRVVFKPQWYERDDVIEGKPYDGPDRHNGEIAAFHLNRLLGLRRAPFVVGRILDLETEIKPVAEERLLKTFYKKGEDVCFYGKCLYCKGPSTGVCGKGPRLEGAMVLWLPHWVKFQTSRHPWGRTYDDQKLARWEVDDHYCDRIRHTPPYDSGPLLLDIIDASSFDYLIGNADRHHFETLKDEPESMMVMLDSAKSFGNPNYDEPTILAPIYQCCRIRLKLWERLQQLGDGVLSRVMRHILSRDPIAPVLSERHLEAMDRRLLQIYSVVERCVESHGSERVFVKDKYSMSGDTDS